jgi:hypothetical protein
LKKNYFSSHKLPKQQSTSFWSQGILGLKIIRCKFRSEEGLFSLALLYGHVVELVD